MTQFGRPISDVTNTLFTGGWAALDEVTASDTDFANTADNVTGQLEVALTASLSDPAVATGHIVRVRLAKADTGVPPSTTGNTQNMTVTLYQGATLIATVYASAAVGAWTQTNYTLTAGEANSITNYTDLRVRIDSPASGGGPSGNRRGGAVSWVVLELPDAPFGGAGTFTADAIVKRTQVGSFTADSVIKRTGIAGSFTADAVIKKTQTSGGGAGAIARVQFVAELANAGSGTTLVLTLSGVTTTVGNHLILRGGGATNAITAVVDSKGNTWQIDKTDTTEAGISASVASAKITSALVDGDTITATIGGSGGAGSAYVDEWSGLHATTWLDKTVGTGAPAALAADSGLTATTADANELIIGVIAHVSTVTSWAVETTSPAWTERTPLVTTGTVRTNRPLDKIVSATGQYASKGTWTTNSRDWSAVVATYKPAPSGGGLTLDAVIAAATGTQSGSFTANAVINKTGIAGSFTANAVIKKTQEVSGGGSASILYDDGLGFSVTGTTWADIAEIPAGSLVANKSYLIVVGGFAESDGASADMGVRVGYGATPTLFTDGTARIDPNLSTAAPAVGFMFVHTQGGTAERYVVQANNASGTATTTGDVWIAAFRLTDELTSGTDYHTAEVTADYTTTASYVNQANVTFTPNGTDKYLVLGWASYRPLIADGTSDVQLRLNDSVDGALVTITQDGEDVTNDIRSIVTMAVVTPSAASHTYSVQAAHSGSTAHTIYATRVFALNLSVYAQNATVRTAGDETTIATDPSWTNVATVAPTPDVTGDWLVLSYLTTFHNTNTSTRFIQTRQQINPSGGGLVSNPAYGDDSPAQGNYKAPDLMPVLFFTKVSLTSGAARTINLDVNLIAPPASPAVRERSIAAFSLLYAGSATDFTIDAYISAAAGGAGTFTVDAVIFRTQTGTLTADAIVRREQVGSFTADSIIKKAQTGSTTADSVIKKTQSSTFTVDSVIKRTGIAGSFTVDAVIRKTQSGTFTANAVINKAQSGSLTLDSIIRKAQTGSFAVDAVIKKAGTGSFTANAALKKTGIAGSFTADAFIQPYFTIDAVIAEGASTVQGTFTADAVVKKTISSSFTADAVIRKTGIAGSFTEDAVIRRTGTSGSFTANAVLKKTQSGSFTADAIIRVAVAGSFTADAILRVAGSGSFTLDAVVLAVQPGSTTLDAVLNRVGRCTWTTPGDTVQISGTEVLHFLMPSAATGDMHFEIELDKVPTFDGGDYRSIKSHSSLTGWQYWDGGTWQAIPQAGVSTTYLGNEARYTIQVSLTNGTWYRRVRAGVI